MKIRCIAIDDEPPALRLVESYAAKIPFLKLEATFSDPNSALAYVNDAKPALVLLDINMPDMRGTELARQLPPDVMTIFCTAYSDHAVEGFDLRATDYLVKPFSFERFLEAVCKVQEQLTLRLQSPRNGEQTDFVFIRSEYSLVKINTGDILFVEGLKDYIKIYTRNTPKPVLSLQSLRALEEKLPAGKFCRVHRSFIVNLAHIASVQRNTIFISDREIPIGTQHRDDLYRLIDARTPR